MTIDADVIPAVTRLYTREAGVRELERRIARIARKLARKAAAAKLVTPEPMHVAAADLKELLGVPPFEAEEQTLEDKVGVATGLAYTAVGGDLLEIEVAVVRGRGTSAAHRNARRCAEGIGERCADVRALAREHARH